MRHFTPLLLILCALLQGCVQKGLCFDHDDHAPQCRVNVAATWQLEWEYPLPNGTDWQSRWPSLGFGMAYDDLRPAKPTGIKVISYPAGRSGTESVIGADGGIFYTHEGEQQLLFYNNNTEYITFNDLDYSASATAGTRGLTRASFNGIPLLPGSSDENTVNAPDPLFGHFIPSYDAHPTVEPVALNIEMRPLVFTYLIRYHFDQGLQYVALARGALSGMAASVYLTDGHTGSKACTILHDCEIKPWGVEAIVRSFGAPDYPNPEYSRADHEYGVNLEVRLRNGKILNFFWDVTDQLSAQPRGGVVEVFGAKVTDEEAKEETGAFDVAIDGWGEWVDIPLEF